MAHFNFLIVLFDMHWTVIKYYWYNSIIQSETGTTKREGTGNSHKLAKLLEALYIFWPGRKTAWDNFKIIFAYWGVTFWLTQAQFFWTQVPGEGVGEAGHFFLKFQYLKNSVPKFKWIKNLTFGVRKHNSMP